MGYEALKIVTEILYTKAGLYLARKDLLQSPWLANVQPTRASKTTACDKHLESKE